MSFAGTLKVTTPSDREIVMTRAFDAPRTLVWDAHTKPELLKRWLGRHNRWSMEICEIDLTVGGAYRYLWRGPDGREIGMRGTYSEIKAPARLVATEKFDESWYPGEALDTSVFTEERGVTTVTLSVVYDSKEIRDAVLKTPMATGMESGYSKLDEVMAAILKEGTK